MEALMVRKSKPSTAPTSGWVRLTQAEAKTYSKVLLVSRKGRPAFGTVTDVYTKWHGHGLILIAKRRGGIIGGQKADDFETKSGRITITGADAYSVAYFRHTGQWWTFVSNTDLKSALAKFRKPSPAWPY
jgi:hypothetical protein